MKTGIDIYTHSNNKKGVSERWLDEQGGGQYLTMEVRIV